MKVKIHGENKYYYPDIFITKEENTSTNRYAKYAPELIIEVSSESTIKTDLIDQLVAYQTITSLQYYLLVEPEEIHIVVFTKDSEGGWLSEVFTTKENKIALNKLDAVLTLSNIYSHL